MCYRKNTGTTQVLLSEAVLTRDILYVSVRILLNIVTSNMNFPKFNHHLEISFSKYAFFIIANIMK